MTRIGRYVRLRAKAGQGDAVAQRLLEAVERLRAFPGCDLYVINRVLDDPDTIWVTEAWRSRADVEASLQAEGAHERAGEVLALLDGRPELVETVPVGGVGLAEPADSAAPYTLVALGAVEDLAAAHGFGERGSARFATGDLAARATGVSLQRLHPGRRQAFGHRHARAEEVYVVLAGSGRARLDDEEVELREGDALRVAPAVTRAFEAGPDGLELLAVGPRTPGDGEVLTGWWGG